MGSRSRAPYGVSGERKELFNTSATSAFVGNLMAAHGLAPTQHAAVKLSRTVHPQPATGPPPPEESYAAYAARATANDRGLQVRARECPQCVLSWVEASPKRESCMTGRARRSVCVCVCVCVLSGSHRTQFHHGGLGGLTGQASEVSFGGRRDGVMIHTGVRQGSPGAGGAGARGAAAVAHGAGRGGHVPRGEASFLPSPTIN